MFSYDFFSSQHIKESVGGIRATDMSPLTGLDFMWAIGYRHAAPTGAVIAPEEQNVCSRMQDRCRTSSVRSGMLNPIRGAMSVAPVE